MLSYQHAFHAGNHADILKHYVLMFVLNSLNKKDKPYTVFDTHSGSGLYDMADNRIVKTGEAVKGIQGLIRLIEHGESVPPKEFLPYLDIVREYNSSGLYPGSPEIERRLLRKCDTLVLSELHPQEFTNLKYNMEKPFVPHGTLDIKIHKRNGWEMIKALTPPATKRGAVLIDPSYEEAQDYIDAAATICEVNKKWSNGIIMLWYPLLAHREGEVSCMIDAISAGAKRVNHNVETLNLTLEVYDKDKDNMPRLYGSGMFVINAPWKLEEESKIVIPYVRDAISPLFL